MKHLHSHLTADCGLLRRLVAGRGMTMEGVADQMGMHRTTLYRHIKQARLHPRDVVGLSRILALTDDQIEALFFMKKSHKCDRDRRAMGKPEGQVK
ncbi:MAG: helix-turn-helix domain-containing protein [Clostridia bacterium]|nr:helix-turn-helix domain-containing protein [Clostridia bacterium]